MAKKAPQVIAITSGKGGVGKTHMTVNIGLALVNQGKRVLLLDADLGLANINIMLGFKPAATIADVLHGNATIQDIIVSHDTGFDIIPATSGMAEMTQLNEHERLHLLSLLEEIGYDYDYIFVDTAAGIGDNVLYFTVAAGHVIVVVDTEPTSITDAYALIKLLSTKHGLRHFHILVNRIGSGQTGKETFANLSMATGKFLDVSLKFLGAISDDSAVVDAVRQQRPFLSLFPSSRASLDVNRVADRILESQWKSAAQGSLQFFFKGMVENA